MQNKLASKGIVSQFEQKIKPCLPVASCVGVAVSGGADSLSLLFAVCHIYGKKTKIIVANVNHNIREKTESQKDSDFVKQTCDTLRQQGYDVLFSGCVLQTGRVALTAKQRGKGTEEAARFLRYEFFLQTAKKHNIKYFFTAHTQNDNIETILMHFLQGSTASGIKQSLQKEKVIFLHPLLCATRQQIEAYLKAQNLQWCIDATNTSNTYLRNKIRNLLVPQLNALFPGYEKSLLHYSLFQEQIQDFLQTQAQKYNWQKLQDKNAVYLAKKEFFSLHPAIKTKVFFLGLTQTGFEKRVSFSLVNKVLQATDSKNLTRDFSFKQEGLLIFANQNSFVIENLSKNKKQDTDTKNIGYCYFITDKNKMPPLDTLLKTATPLKANDANQIKLPCNIKTPFLLRSPQPFDVVQTKDKTQKSLSAILQGLGVPKEKRNITPLLQECCDNCNIKAVLGSFFGGKDWVVKD